MLSHGQGAVKGPAGVGRPAPRRVTQLVCSAHFGSEAGQLRQGQPLEEKTGTQEINKSLQLSIMGKKKKTDQLEENFGLLN